MLTSQNCESYTIFLKIVQVLFLDFCLQVYNLQLNVVAM